MSVHAVEMSHLNALAVHRMSLAMEEFPSYWGCPDLKTATGPGPSCGRRASSAAAGLLKKWMRKDRSQWRKTKHDAPSCSRLRVCADARKDGCNSNTLKASLDLILNLYGLRD